MRKLEVICLLAVMAFGLILRIYGLNWDQGYHLHPDERALTMIADRIAFPKTFTLDAFISPDSPLNPKFFAYGSFPIYLLKSLGSFGSLYDKTLGNYDKINILGRIASVVFDIGTICVIYLLTKSLFKNKRAIPLVAALFYAISVLPIQLSHFFAVDTILNFFIVLCLYSCIRYTEKINISGLLILGLTAGLAFATKFTGVLLVIPILATILISSFRENLGLVKKIKYLFTRFIFFFIIFALSAFLFMPYAFIDFTSFTANISEQLRMSKDPYVFPFTLQYVNTTPYLYPLQQIFLWGMGPLISLFSFIGLILILRKGVSLLRKETPYRNYGWIILIIFNLFYFLLVGRSAVKFMRYYLPLYPLLAILAAYFIDTFLTRVKHLLGQHITLTIILLLVFISLLWPLSFINIYNKPNTRVAASDWINKNIKEGSVLAIEHWDDRLPISGGEKFSFVEMPMYEPDGNEKKWETVERNLKVADYIILASNRLYVPLSKLGDCTKIKPVERCYPKTEEYYKKMFSGDLGFVKTAEFTNYPKLSINSYQLTINDFSADENFTVFDHPKISIFKKL